jgi:predicted Na+-dependent transporter
VIVALSTEAWWILGWVIGAVVVLIAALLLIAIIGLARRVVRQAGEITAALEGAAANTAPLYDLTRTNLALDRVHRGLAQSREEAR